MWLLIKNMEEYKTLKVNKMSYAKTRLENDKRKNKPNIVFPIINTIFATILMGIVIFLFCTSKGSFGIGLFIKETIEEELKAGILKEVFIDFELPQLNLCLVYFRKDLSMAAKEFLNNYLTNKKTKLN